MPISVRTFQVFAAALVSLPALAGPQLRRAPAHASPARETAASNKVPNLVYCGGRILSQAKIVPVLWGPAESPVPASATCTGEFKDCLDSWYADFVNSPQFDWLDEYQTTGPAQDGSAGTNQHLLHPTVVKTIQIAPINTRSVVGELDVENEIVAQIAAGHLPAPDADSETIYEMHFPLTVDPSDPNMQACSDFCAYHDSWISNTLGKTGIIAILPSHMPPGYSGGRNCSECGEKSDWFANLGGSISHETIEAITDPDVGQSGAGCSAPLGWYDLANTDGLSYHGEIGDICEGIPNVSTASQVTEVTLAGSNAFNYTVQREWSDQFSACMVDKAIAFSVSVPDSPLTLDVGTALTASVVTTLPANGDTSIPVKLAARGVPTGTTVTFSPATISAGQTSTMTVTLGSGTVTGGSFGITAESGLTQAQATVSLSAPEYTAMISPSSLALTAGGPAGSVVLSTAVLTGSARAFTVKATGAAGIALAETSGELGTDLTLHFAAAAGTPSAHSTINVLIISGGVSKSLPIQLALSGDDATLTAPANVTAAAGGSVSFTITTTVKSGNAQPLALSATGLPDGATAVFAPTSVTAGQTAMCTISIPATEPLLPIDLKIIGKGAITSYPAPVEIAVTAAPSSGCAQTDLTGLALLGLCALLVRSRRRAARV